MSEDTIDIVVIQNISKCADPSTTDRDNCEGYLLDLQKYFRYDNPIIARDIPDFIRRTREIVVRSNAKIKNLIIGSHGHGGSGAYFRIGNNVIDSSSSDYIDPLRF